MFQEKQHNHSDKRQYGEHEPIAIIGMSCRFPGAKDIEAFWTLLCSGSDAITEIPGDRFDIESLYDPRPGIPGKMATRWGGFLEDIDRFDCAFFGISPREAAHLDPQARLLLEIAWEALEDAGERPDLLVGSQTGVFIGSIYNDYGELQTLDLDNVNIYALGGGLSCAMSGYISHVLDLRGPSLTIDTACSSSLVATHLACQSLWKGECQIAFAGGVNLILQPKGYIGFSQAGMQAQDGRCKAFDARADGFVRSEGAGIVVLKPLSQAQADGNPIYAVIRGSAVGNDGRSGGPMMTPGAAGQAQVLKDAYRQAGIVPGRVQYIEAHGTGTRVGDPVEVEALTRVLSEGRSPDQRCILGSVKTNIGHTEGAAGIAGLIKTALSLKHHTIPPDLHMQTPNPGILWDAIPFEVPSSLRPWPSADHPALAGVSSFGMTGTNTHIVLEEAPTSAVAHKERELVDGQAQLLVLSACNPQALYALAQAYQQFLLTAENESTELVDICYTASVRRTHHDYRLALVARSRAEMAERLKHYQEEVETSGARRCTSNLQHKPVFVFPGQGSQWFGMGRRLLEQEPVFRDALERCEQAMRPYTDWSLLDILTSNDEAHSGWKEIDRIQPAIFAIQVALSALWQSWGIVPDAVVGHSMGEVAAAHVAGILSLDDAARIICRRSTLLRRVSGQGAMAVVGLTLPQAQQVLADYKDHLAIAVSNSQTSTVLSGDRLALEELLATLQKQKVPCHLIQVDVASHSPQMDPLLEDLQSELQGIQPRRATLPFYSTVTTKVEEGTACDSTYWVHNLRLPVLFSDALHKLLADQHHIFLEVSPHPVLVNPIQQSFQHFGQEGLALPSLLRDEDERAVLLEALGKLYMYGLPVQWELLYGKNGNCVRTPSYPWQRERHWYTAQGTHTQALPSVGVRYRKNGVLAHPLLQQYLHLANQPSTYCWETNLDVKHFGYLVDHRVQNTVVFPAAAYLEVVQAAGREVFGDGTISIGDISFHKALFLREEGPQRLQIILKVKHAGTASFECYTLPDVDKDTPEPPTLHASGTLKWCLSDGDSEYDHLEIDEIQKRCQDIITAEMHYQSMHLRGLDYGANFRGIEQIWCREGEAIARLRLPVQDAYSTSRYHIHPTLLDTSFQALAATFSTQYASTVADTYLPVSLRDFSLREIPQQESLFWCYARLLPGSDSHADLLEGEVTLLDGAGKVLLTAHGLRFQRLEQASRERAQQNIADWLYTIQWDRVERTETTASSAKERATWLIMSDDDEVGDALTTLLQAHNQHCIHVYPGSDYQRITATKYYVPPSSQEAFHLLLEDLEQSGFPPLHGIVHLWSLNTPVSDMLTGERLIEAQEDGCESVMHLVQSLINKGFPQPPQLFLVTRGTQHAGEKDTTRFSAIQAPLWGMGRTIFYEHPELRCRLVDLSVQSNSTEVEWLYQELWSATQEEQVALRGEQRYVARLMPLVIPSVSSLQQSEESPQYINVGPDHPFRLETTLVGTLDKLVLRETVRTQPAAGEVEIQVHAAGLNFRDVLLVMGISIGEVHHDSPSLGYECAGIVTSVGAGVTEFSVGDEVIAATWFSLGSYAIAPVTRVVRKPTYLSFEEAATIPIAFLTAYYALYSLARLRPGERILIHAAAGGVGMAAIQLAQLAGAEIFATAGDEKKRTLLQSLGVQHVMDSRSLKFTEEILTLTEGRGVDVVLNSLAGEALTRGLDVLAPYGRFLEIGMRDIAQNSLLGLQPFQKNLSFFSIELLRITHERPQLIGSLLQEIIHLFDEGKLKPLPLTVFPMQEASAAFRYMAQARHIGKIVISLSEQPFPIIPLPRVPQLFRDEATYLLTGGLGGLGLTMADWMIEHGARHIALLGRRGPSPTALQAIAAMQQRGAQVVVLQADVTREEQITAALHSIANSLPPLRGIFHAATILEDRTLLQLDQQSLFAVMKPKMLGAWYLHRATQDMPLDFFVLFSSLAGVMGSPGQSNYNAANTFLDTLAHLRQAQGLPALSINWGIWAEVGLAAAQTQRGQRLSHRGFGAMSSRLALQVLEHLLTQTEPQVVVSPLHIQLWCQYYPVANNAAMLSWLREREALSSLPQGAVAHEESIRSAILNVPPEERLQKLISHLSKRVAKILGFAQTQVDVRQPLNRMGIDSLMAVELRNAIEADFGVSVPVTSFLKGLHLTQLAQELLDQLPDTAPADASAESTVTQLSDQEVDALLGDLLARSDVSLGTLLQNVSTSSEEQE
jgi:acyl transferase domain-containing protein/acyl carrier protein